MEARAALYLAVVYWSPPDLRASLSVLALAVLIRLTDGAVRGTTLLRAVAAAAICATAFLISADTGLYCVAAVVLCVGATAVVTRSTRDMTIFLVQAAIALGVMVLTINAVMFSPLDFRFWRSSLAIATGYRWFEPLAMAKFSKHLVMKILAVGLSVFVLAAVWRRPRRNWTARPAFLLAGFLFALVTLQAALVRSDYAHVLVGTYAMVFLCGVIVLDRFDSGLAGAVSALAVAVATVALVPTPMIRPGNLIDEVRRFWHPMWTCPAGPDLDGACLIPHETQWLSDISAFVNLHAGPGDPIAVLPYQTAFGLLSRHQVAGGVMQSYLVNGDYLTALDLRGLEAAKPPVALYFPESGIDSVPTLTRNGDAWSLLSSPLSLGGAVAIGRGGIGTG